ncbi:uncharacterized protein LOC142787388 [Rhipicephalus microplus]|uniref:uncharacterized protein LOC142787388 n=1 Tax=Rhipicephalus microplus TaxID=6941 RepID=UPI003F6CF630
MFLFKSYRALQVHTETTSEDTMPSLDYMQGNLMERYRAGSDSFDTDYETTTEGVPTRRQPSFPRRVMAFVDKINSKSSLPQIFLATIFKVLVLIMIKQYSDQTPPLEPGSSADSECSSPSHMSTTQIAAWKAAYAQRSSTLHTIQERTHAEVQASCAGEAIRTPRSVAATPSAKAKTAPEVRLGPASPKEPSSTQRRSCECSPSPPGSPREDKGLLGSLDASHETIKPGEQAGGSGTSTSCRPAAPGQGVGAASKKHTPSRATAPEKSSAHCDVLRHARRSDVTRHTAEKASTESEEPSISTKFFVTADETLVSTCMSSKTLPH